ncbi:hypothetical protein RhiirB3_448998 [Rhizophagus irregularis]|nr:hypothetical protein RhiirB3_448998 [Rhizophagus irregularis]
MSCSKIFSGDLPELIFDIIKYFQDDYSTLYSCVLVNRLWCRLTIPLLWENPFSIPTKNYNFIKIYLHNLNDDLKTKLNEYKINDNPLFNYPSFLKYMNIYKVISSVGEWWLEGTSKLGSKYFFQDNFREIICMSLFKMFIENEVNLYTLEIDTYYNTYCDNVLGLILQNPNFIHNIGNLKLFISNYNENTLIKNRISQLVNLHQNTKKILLRYNNLSLYQSLLLSNCSNTLNTIIFYYVNFKGVDNLVKVFENLNALKSVQIIYCYSLDNGFAQIINLTKPFKLKTLFISEKLQFDLLKLLLQKSGDYLENFGLNSNFNLSLLLKQQLLELVPEYCKNIRFFNLYKIKNQINSLIFNLIENVKQNLNYLTMSTSSYGNNECSSIILQNLGQILPSKLEYLNLILHIKENDFEIFLKNSQDTFFEKLLINNIEGQNILPCIKEYIMKNERVKHLGYNGKNGDLSKLKDEVKEFKLHNIKVQRYNELFIDINNFVMNID